MLKIDDTISLKALNLILESFTQAINKKLPIPREIVAIDKTQKGKEDYVASISTNLDVMKVYNYAKYWDKPDSIVQRQRIPDQEGNTFWASGDKKAAINHELGHQMFKTLYPEIHKNPKTKLTKYDIITLKNNLSKYSVFYYEKHEKNNKTQLYPKTCKEIVAEVISKYLNDESIHPDVLKIFDAIVNGRENVVY